MELLLEDWGLIDYQTAYARQKALVEAVMAGEKGRLIFCEHPAVITLGRSSQKESFLYSHEEIQSKGVDIQTIDRGGDVTLHSPGQLVVYLIIDLNLLGRDLKVFLEKVEQVAVDLLKDFGILAVSIPGKRGVFVGRDKIISIGIGVRKWVSYHGVGINVNTDLKLFSLIKPCGLDVKMTSMEKLAGSKIDLSQVKSKWIKAFKQVYKVEILT